MIKNKIVLYAIGTLIVIILGQSVQIGFLHSKVNKVYDSQVDEITKLKETNQVKTDSIEILKKKKISSVRRKEKTLYNSVDKAKQNNIRYEQLKKDAISNNSTDSLERQLSDRYQEKR